MKSMRYTNRPCPTDEYLACVQDTKILDDLGKKCSPCNHTSHPSRQNNIGLRVPALALLAANTPRAVRVHPTKHCRIFEALPELVRQSSIWRIPNNHTTIDFGKYLGSDSSSIFFNIENWIWETTISGDRLTRRVVDFFGENGALKMLNLGYSWLASREDYLALRDFDEEDEIKSRP